QLRKVITERRAALALAPTAGRDPAREKRLIEEKKKAEEEYEKTWREILNATPAYHALMDHEAATQPLAVLRKTDLKKAPLLVFHVQRNRSYAFLVADDRSEPEWFPLVASAELIEELLE